MAVTAGSVRPYGVASLLSAPRLLVALGVPAAFGMLTGVVAPAPAIHVTCAVAMGLAATLLFGVLELHPKRLPAWLPRWVLDRKSTRLNSSH